VMPADLAEFVESYQRTWNTHDGSALAALFAADADLIMGADPRVEGRAAIAAWWDDYFARIDPGRGGTFSVTSARLISADAAIVNVDSTTSGRRREGQPILPTRLARGTWIMVRESHGWTIAGMRGQPAVGESRTTAGSDRG
jgi:uncharacterized protein (TIGR02246 family)